MITMSEKGLFNYAGSPLTSFERKRRRFPFATAVRLLLGATFVLVGLNGFFGFMPTLRPTSQFEGFVSMLQGSAPHSVLMGLQVLGGLCVLSRRLVNLGIFLLGPIAVQILIFHISTQPEGAWLAAVMLTAVVYLAWRNRDVWARALFSPGR